MTPQERRIAAELIALRGIVLHEVTDYAETKPEKDRQRILHHVKKVDEALMKLFNAIRYERMQWELEEIRRFVNRSRIFLLAPDDEETVQHLLEKERRWIEGDYALAEGAD